VFVDEGQLADVFTPGTYTLITQNLPLLSTLRGWKYGFESPFKAEVYFVNMRQFTDQKWGTKNPIMLRDAEFGPVRLRAFGTYAIKVKEAAKVVREIVGTDGHFTTDEITNQLRDIIITRFTTILGESKIPVLDLAANYNQLGEFIAEKLRPEFEEYGLDLAKLLVENISLPPAVEEVLDKRTSMGIVGDLRAYTQFQAAQAIEKAAENPGGLAGGGMGIGMGFVMANQMGQTMGQAQPPSSGPSAPPPVPQSAMFHVAMGGQATGPFDMATLEQKVQAGEITRETPVWKQGMAQWAPAGEVSEFANLFASVPPPLPPQQS
jgi:membrane protease subunit (stomatin/prohibitin family)